MQLLQQQAQQKEKTSPFEIKCLGSPVATKNMFIVMESQLSIYMYASLWGDFVIQDVLLACHNSCLHSNGDCMVT